jgi:hypothetical protein
MATRLSSYRFPGFDASRHAFATPSQSDTSRPSVFAAAHGAEEEMDVDDLIMREEVPFERWLVHFGMNRPLESHLETLMARGYAVLAFGESLFKAGIEATAYLVSKIVEKVFSIDLECDHHWEVCKQQFRSMQFSMKAIASPNHAKEKAFPEGKTPLFGCTEDSHAWGTDYHGRQRKNPFAFECCDYPWIKG